MKYLYLFLLVSSTVFSQNYHYAVDEAKEPATPDTTAPSNPINLVASNITQSSATLSWTASTDNVGVADYRVYNNGILLLDSTGGSVSSFILTGLSNATDYVITVRAVDAAGNISEDSNIENFRTNTSQPTDNLPEEEVYFDCYLLPYSQRAQLQAALNTHGCVRLEPGDYSGTAITMTSNQSLYGFPTSSNNNKKVPDITIAAGSTNVLIENVADATITFASGSPITNVTIKSLYYSRIVTTSGMIENCEFINLDHVLINFDCSVSGYIRNNRVMKQWMQGGSPQVVLKGNSTTPSYGNIQSFIIYQTSDGNVSEIDNMGDMTYLGIDSEAWGFSKPTTEAMLKMTNMGNVVLTDLNGGNGPSAYKTPAFDIEGESLLLFNRRLQSSSSRNDVVRNRTDLFVVSSFNEPIEVESGYNFRGHFNGPSTSYNGSNLITAILNGTIITNLTNTILRPKYTPIDRYNYPTLPDPTGAAWATDRTGQTDSTSYIQGLIDTNGIAELDEGIYYIGSTLVVNPNEGIIGAGTGKTAIVGLTDDFPLISAEGTGDVKMFSFSNMTLQGGSTGIRVNKTASGTYQLAGNNWKYLVFRNQNYGIHIDRIYGLDTNVLDNASFVDCNIGFFQDPNPSYGGGETDDMSYVDKLMMYRCQFINNNIAIRMNATRSNNLNAWQDCLFDGNGIAVELANNNAPIFSNSDFRDNTGGYVISSGDVSIYSCSFTGNSTSYLFHTLNLFMEGCTISDNIPLLDDVWANPQNAYIMNSTITGDKGYLDNGVLINSVFKSNPGLSKLLLNIVSGTATTLLNVEPDPYPQFLVKH